MALLMELFKIDNSSDSSMDIASILLCNMEHICLKYMFNTLQNAFDLLVDISVVSIKSISLKRGFFISSDNTLISLHAVLIN